MIDPPSDDPVDMIPNANALFVLNHCEAMAGIGLKIIPQHHPVRSPWQRRSCQNLVHSAVSSVATTNITLIFRYVGVFDIR